MQKGREKDTSVKEVLKVVHNRIPQPATYPLLLISIFIPVTPNEKAVFAPNLFSHCLLSHAVGQNY